MFLRYNTRLLVVGVFIVGIAAGAWRYLEIDTSPPPTLPETASHVTADNSTAAPGLVEPNASSSSATRDTISDTGLSDAVTPLSLKEVLTVTSRFERQQLLERFGFDMAKEGTEAALRTLAEIAGPADRAIFLRGMFTHLAEDRGEAFRAVKLLAEDIDRETALSALVANWRREPLSLDAQAALVGRHGTMGGMVASLLGDPLLTAECANELLSGMQRAHLIGSASGLLAATDPQQALALGSRLEGKERTEFLLGLASGWARTSGAAAWAWCQQQADPALRDLLQEAIVSNWGAHDPAAAAAALGQIGNAESRQKLIDAVAGRWANADTKAAIAWANELSLPQERDAATAAIQKNAPSGIGIMLSEGPDGYPLIRDMVPGGTASSSGVLESGYQIAAVGNGSGQFTDLHGKNLQDVTSLIRGKPGSNVWLQVIRPGGTPAGRVTVVVPRQQIMFKNPPAP